MKKHFILSLVVLLAFGTANVSARVGLEAGYLNSTFHSDMSGHKATGDPFNGFRIGLSSDSKIVAGLSIRSGLGYSYMSHSDESKMNVLLTDLTLNNRQVEQYLDLPIHLSYGFSLFKIVKIFVYGGPRLVLGLSSKNMTDLSGTVFGIGNVSGNFEYNFYRNKISSDNLSDEIMTLVNNNLADTGKESRFDVEMGVGLGVELFNVLTVKGGYDWGLINRYTGTYAEDNALKRNQFHVSVGFLF